MYIDCEINTIDVILCRFPHKFIYISSIVFTLTHSTRTRTTKLNRKISTMPYKLHLSLFSWNWISILKNNS